MTNRTLAALVVACAVALGGCLSTIDSRSAEVSDRLAARCADLQSATTVVDLFVPDKLRTALGQGRIVLEAVCAAPPRNTAELAVAIGRVIAALQAIEAAKRA